MLSAGCCVWLPYILCITSGLSLWAVRVRARPFKVYEQVLLVNIWLVCGIDQRAESLKSGLMLSALSFLERRPPLSTINIKKFLKRTVLIFIQSPPSCLSQSQ